MKELLKFKQQRLMGVDLAEDEIKITEVVRGAEISIEAVAQQQLPDLASVRDTSGYIEVTGTALRQAVQASGAKGSKAVIAVSGSEMMTHEIEVPAELEESELEARVGTEAAAHFPLPLEDLALDFIVLTQTERLAKAGSGSAFELPHPETKSVLIVACPLALLEIRCAALAQAGLEVVCVDVDLFALERTYAFLSKQLPTGDALGAVHLSSHAITLYLAAAGRIHFSAVLPNISTQSSQPVASSTSAVLALAESEPAPWQHADITTRIRTGAEAANLKLTHFLADGTAHDEPALVRQIEGEIGLKIPAIHPLTASAKGCALNQTQLSQLTSKLVLSCGLALRQGV